ncbi:MAG: tyrosine-type recombinase/integrase [Eubacteriales bacterium]|nr:tyrosine-type recombinase/integrase [Eubacteriales bacterium]
MPNLPYHEQTDKYIYNKLAEMLPELPPFCRQFFRGIEPRTQSRTRLAYAYDLHVFFTFLLNENPEYRKRYDTIRDFRLRDLDSVALQDIEEYMEYLKYRPGEGGGEIANRENGIKRKIASLKSFYNYFYNNEMIETNPAAKARLPKLHQKDIVRLNREETDRFLEEAETGSHLTERQKAYHEKTKIRDTALLSLLLGTGMRVSECVGINLSDLNLKECGVLIHRKGGKEVTIYFGDDVAEALLPYLEERKHILPAAGSEDSLFLSLQNKRIAVRSVENLVKKYARTAAPLKRITPHKLRSTYGTALYRETGDIYLVADVLGHADVNTTKKHYAAIEDDRRRMARDAVKLREDTNENG